MTSRQSALGGFVVAALIFGASASPVAPAGGQASVVGIMAQIDRQTTAVFDGLHNWRNAALDVAFDAYGALVARIRQFSTEER